MESFPGYARRQALMKKNGLTRIETEELSMLDSELEAFKRKHPDWDPNKEPLRVSFMDGARFTPPRRPRG